MFPVSSSISNRDLVCRMHIEAYPAPCAAYGSHMSGTPSKGVLRTKA